MMRSVFWMTLCIASIAMVSLAAPPSSRRLLPPPENSVVEKIAGHTYAKGDLYLSSHADTALLKPYGFRRFHFQGWSLGRARYSAAWPLNVPLDSLPSNLQEIEYAQKDLTGLQPEQEDEWLFDTRDSDYDSWTQVQPEDEGALTLPVRKNVSGRKSAARTERKSQRIDRKDDSYYYWDNTKKELRRYDVVKDPDLTGTFPMFPVDKGAFRSRYSYESDDNLYNRGTFITSPTERGSYHRVESVTTKDPARTGTFFTTSESRTTLKASPIQEMYRGQTRPMGFQFGTPDNAPRDSWRGVSQMPRPRGMSLSEYQRQHGSGRH